MHAHRHSITVSAHSGQGAVPAAFSLSAVLSRVRPTVMTRLYVCVIVSLATHAALAVSTARGDAALDAAFQTLTTLELGQDLQLLNPIELAMVQSRSDATVRTDLEARLIAVLPRRGDGPGQGLCLPSVGDRWLGCLCSGIGRVIAESASVVHGTLRSGRTW